jgi:hypothetical protein
MQRLGEVLDDVFAAVAADGSDALLHGAGRLLFETVKVRIFCPALFALPLRPSYVRLSERHRLWPQGVQHKFHSKMPDVAALLIAKLRESATDTDGAPL